MNVKRLAAWALLLILSASGICLAEESGSGAMLKDPDLFYEEHVDEAHSRAILFATPTCPNCRIACTYLDKAGFKYEKLMAEDNAELALSFGVKQAPTLVITDGREFEKFAGAGAIKTFLDSQKQ